MDILLKKGDFVRLVSSLLKDYTVIAPSIDDKRSVFKEISNADEVDVCQNPLYPAKDYWLPQGEVLLEFDQKTVKDKLPNPKKKIALLLRPCDANAIFVNDKIFLDKFPDPYYKARRDNIVIISMQCTAPLDKNCFCKSMGYEKPKVFDINLIDHHDTYLLEFGSDTGKKIIDPVIPFLRVSDDVKRIEMKQEKNISLKPITSGNEDIFRRYAEKCLSCSACNVVCPTCSCFEIKDELDNTIKAGKRIREWSSCQLTDYTRVAGNYIFRNDRYKRARQRVYCKFKYYKEKFGVDRCTGCGRCITACPVNIDFAGIRNELK